MQTDKEKDGETVKHCWKVRSTSAPKKDPNKKRWNLLGRRHAVRAA